MSGPRTVRAPRGIDLTCKNWLSEAAYRMIQNNLDLKWQRNRMILSSMAGRKSRPRLGIVRRDP